MNILKKIQLIHRANKYQTKDDIGGIKYLHAAILQGDIVFDIGAHKGGYTYFMQRLVGKSGHVHAFEPQQLLYEYLIEMKGIMKWDNVSINHVALSDKRGNSTLYIPDNKKSKGSSPGATLLRHEKRTDFNKQEDVDLMTLDRYCAIHDIKPNFLKIDVEGNELKVFDGGKFILSQYKPKILVEIEARHIGEAMAAVTFSNLFDYGYTCKVLHPAGATIPYSDFNFRKYQNPDDSKNYCNNFIFE